MCDRCKNPDVTKVTEYTITKSDGSKRKTTLCDACAEITREVHKLSGGKGSEATPSTPEPEPVDDIQSHTPQGGGGHSGHPVPEGGGVKTNPAKKGK